MAKNDFKPFATAANANVMSQADWEGLPALLSGFTSGKAASAEVNKAIRQASFIAAALAQYTANKSGLDVLDDGDLNGFITKMSAAFGKDFQALDATLTALAGLATGANKLPYFTGTDTAAQTDLTSVGRDIIGKNTIADILTYLGLVDSSNRVGRMIGKPQVVTSTQEITPPAGAKTVRVRGCGGGASGGGTPATNSSSVAIASAGGAGAYAESVFDVTFSSIVVTIGAGGVSAGPGANAGRSGGASYFGSLLSIPGGNPGVGGTLSSSNTIFTATAGQTANPTGGNVISIPGAGSVQPFTYDKTNFFAMSGANSPIGVGGKTYPTGGNGNRGSGYGSGGGAAVGGLNMSAFSGGDGTDGVFILEWYA